MAFDYSKGERPEESYLDEFITWYCTNPKCRAHDEDKKRPKACPFCGCTDLNYSDVSHWDDIKPGPQNLLQGKPFVKWGRR